MTRYHIDSIVGSGSHGEILKAFDTVLDRNVALKSLKYGKTKSDIAPLVREAKALALLSHPNIVTVYDVTEFENETYLVMEFVNGISLAEKLEAGALPVDVALKMMAQLTDALTYAHDLNIVHGDLKPSNIMIDQDGHPILIDFGLASPAGLDDILATIPEGQAATTSLEGTLPYLAPEKIEGRPSDHRAEIFALGAIFNEMLTGVRAFNGSDQAEILNQILNRPPPAIGQFAPEVPAWLEQLIDEMLEKNPDKRIASIAAVHTRIAQRGKRSWQSVIAGYAHRFGRQITRKRSAPGWLKIAAGLFVLGLIGWTGSIIMEDIAPSVSVRMDNGVELVRHFEKDGAVAESKAVFSSILSEDPDHAGAEAGLALALTREYTSQETDPATLRRATALAESALARDPQLALANIAAAWAAEFNGDFDRAEPLYDMADILDPDNALIFEGRARSLKKQGDLAGAAKLLRKAIEVYPDESIFYDGYGDILARKGNFIEAERAFRKGISAQPDNAQGYANLSHVLHMQGKTKEAIGAVQSGLKIRKNAHLYNNLGTYLFFQGRYEQAVIAFERNLELEGNSHRFIAWANLADAQRHVPEKAEAAIASYRRAIQLLAPRIEKRPKHEGLNSRLAIYAVKAGDFETARKALALAMGGNIKESGTYYRAMVTQEIMGNRIMALDMMNRALDSGYPLNEIANDPDLSGLRQDPEYHQIISNRRTMK